MKIGVIAVGNNLDNDLYVRLEPWEQAKSQHKIDLVAVNSLFIDYHKDETIINEDRLSQERLENSNIFSNVIFVSHPVTESQARNFALLELLKNNPNLDYIWLLDLADEYYTLDNINNIIDYIKKYPQIVWFKINFKNYVFDGSQWIDGFCPPRIFSNNIKYRISEFYWDNDIVYNESVKQWNLANREIPRGIAHVKHLTWLNHNGKEKCEYQERHFGECSYRWNEEKNSLEFNKEFFIKHGISLPELKK